MALTEVLLSGSEFLFSNTIKFSPTGSKIE
jgi:hypothetical protein